MSEESLQRELEHYRERCSDLERRLSELESENRVLMEKLSSFEITVSAVVARSIDARADTTKKRYKKSERKEGH